MQVQSCPNPFLAWVPVQHGGMAHGQATEQSMAHHAASCLPAGLERVRA